MRKGDIVFAAGVNWPGLVDEPRQGSDGRHGKEARHVDVRTEPLPYSA